MAVKSKLIYACQACGAQAPKWSGQCHECEKWNTIVQETAVGKNSYANRFTGYAQAAQNQKVTKLSQVPLEEQQRMVSGFSEFDHVLGGGFVPGSVVLIGGDPGIGKSTLLLQILAQFSAKYSSLYISGEESLQQITLRAKRLELPEDDLLLLAETSVERIIHVASEHQPKVLVIDSIQTVHSELQQSTPGSVSQVREGAAQLVRFAKQTGTVVLLVGHVTKEGNIAGPRVLEHMVDTVLYFEGRQDSRFRVIRAVKNRFGAVNELGVFAMTEKGLRGINNPSAIFLTQYKSLVSGSAVIATWEGSRPLLVEIQALVDESHLGNPRRVCVGLDPNRLSMLLAVLHRHGGIPTYDQDVFLNVVGGMKVTETAADLGLLMAVLSSLRNKPLPNDLVIFGEVGLAGEIRPVQNGQDRLREAAKIGFKRALIPKANAPQKSSKDIEVIAVDQLSEALTQI